MNSFPHISCDELIDQARRGIPQGSSTSPLIAMIECSKLELSHELESALFNYADDFLSLFKKAQEAKSVAGKLEDAVEDLPGGNFTLKSKGIEHLSEGCIFLGHHIQLIDGAVRISPSDLNYMRLMSRLETFQKECGVFSCGVIGEQIAPEKKQKILQAISDSRAYLNSWVAAFAECDDLDNSLIGECEKDIKMMMAKVGATLGELEACPSSKVFKFRYSNTR